jgi:predicted enzyme related to lactoylglutathione lyase
VLKERKTHTTVPVADLSRAKAFYKDKLGLEPIEENEQASVFETGGGTRFILYPTPNTTRGGHTQMGFTVDAIEAEVADLKAKGVVFEEYDFPGVKTENSVATSPAGRAAWFIDSEGNVIGLFQPTL